jgi:protein TonB
MGMTTVPDSPLKLTPPAGPQGSPAKARMSVAPVPFGHVPTFAVERKTFTAGILSNLRDFLFERPIKIQGVQGRARAPFTTASHGSGVAENFKELFRPAPRVSQGPSGSRLEINWNAGFGSFGHRVKELFFPTKLAPLQVTSKPVKVKSIWSKDQNFGWTQVISLASHALLIAVLLVPIIQNVAPPTTEAKTKVDVTQIDLSPYVSKLPAGKDKAGGGGGGGDRSQLPPTKGKAPRFDWTQYTPPSATIKNPDPKLPMDPTLLGPPDLKVPNPNLSNYGDPLAKIVNYSGGPGGGGGIGTGCCGGIGSGEGGGLGPGSGGGTGGGVFRAGVNGVGIPICVYCPDPQYSEEARKAKYQGTVVLQVIVTADGRATNISVVKGPGLGLEEKAIEAVRGWRFKPAVGPSGKSVPVIVPIEVTFRLF